MRKPHDPAHPATPERIDPRSALVVVGGALLLVSLFLSWYRPSLEAWSVFELVDVLLLVLAVAAIAAVLPAAPPALRTALPWVCGAAFLLVAVSVIDPPPAASGAERDTGAWLALAGVLLMALGWALAFARISVHVDVRTPDEPASGAGEHHRHRSEPAAATPAQPATPATPAGSAAPAADDEDPTRRISTVG